MQNRQKSGLPQTDMWQVSASLKTPASSDDHSPLPRQRKQLRPGAGEDSGRHGGERAALRVRNTSKSTEWGESKHSPVAGRTH